MGQINGTIVLAPLKQLQSIQPDHVFFALAQDEVMLHGIALQSMSVDWQDVFNDNHLRTFFDLDTRRKMDSMDHEAVVTPRATESSVCQSHVSVSTPRSGRSTF